MSLGFDFGLSLLSSGTSLIQTEKSPLPSSHVSSLAGPPPIERPLVRSLQTLGISGKKCFDCCMRGRNNASRLVSNLADDIEYFLTYGPGQNTLNWNAEVGVRMEQAYFTAYTQVPIVPPVEAPVSMPRVGGAASVILVIKVVGDIWAAKNSPAAALALQTHMLKAAATGLRETAQYDCEDCIRNRVWGQDKAEKKRTLRWWSGLGRTRKAAYWSRA